MMDEYNIEYRSITPCRYAKGMLRHVKTYEPDALINKLIIGAYIEALHYQDYLTLAEEIAGKDISERVAYFGEVEADLILSSDSDFKFHSGLPVFNEHA